ncbi:MAG: Ig-like domain-containing protein [Flavobacteriales bacterium]|jgi:hypothetical protein
MKKLLFWSMVIFIWGCAQQKPLSGGERDFTAPVVVNMFPQNLQKNFSEKLFTIEFDEYVALNNIYQELLISPPMKTQPLVKVKNRTVIVQIKDTLQPNTTYTFNFSDGVVDLNEGNKAEDLLYVFSTGDSIDSLALHGTASYPITNELAAGARVLVFSDTVDFSKPGNKQPSYFTKTKKDGTYVLPFMKEGSYNVIALEDLNGNYNVDEDERVSSLVSKVSPQAVDSTAPNLDFKLFEQILKGPSLANYEVDSTGVFILPWSPFFAQKIELDLQFENNLEGSLYLNEAKDSIFYELVAPIQNRNVDLYVKINDEVDTVAVPHIKDEFRIELKFSHNVDAKWRINDTMIFQTPFMSRLKEGNELMQLFEDSVLVQEFLPKTLNEREYFATPQLKEGKKYKLLVGKGLVEDQFLVSNDSLKINFQTYRSEDLGVVELDIDPAMAEQTGWLEIYDKTKILVWKKRLQPNDQKLRIEKLIPNEYSVRYFIDVDGNELWNPIDFDKGIPAEEIYVFPEKINVRANWDLKVSLKLPV